MGELFLRLLGASPPEGGGRVTGASFGLQPAVPPALVVVAFILLAALSFFVYTKTPRDVRRPRRLIMAGLRALLFGLILLLLLRPTLNLTVENETRRTLLGLIDTSASFNLRDAGTETRLDSALAEISGGGLLRALAEDLDLAFYSFDRSISSLDIDLEAPDLNLTAAGQQTALGNSLRELLNRRRGEALAGVFLTSDGVNTTGESPLDAAAALRDAGIPLYVYGVGSTLVQDLAIESVDVSGTTLVGDAVPVTVRVRSRGMAGKTGRVKLSLAGAAAATEEITFGEDGTSEVSLAFLPNQPGDFELEATVESEVEEIHPDNNRWGRQLRVLDSSIRVLMVEQSPRWEFKYIQAMLLREQRVDLDCLLLEADPEITRTPGSPYILAFPQRREDLFAYDLILLGDVDPKSFSNSQIENLSDFVSEAGGSLAVLAGKRFMPDAYRFSPLASLLPVEVSAGGQRWRHAPDPAHAYPGRTQGSDVAAGGEPRGQPRPLEEAAADLLDGAGRARQARCPGLTGRSTKRQPHPRPATLRGRRGPFPRDGQYLALAQERRRPLPLDLLGSARAAARRHATAGRFAPEPAAHRPPVVRHRRAHHCLRQAS